jgi:hypothetical protein
MVLLFWEKDQTRVALVETHLAKKAGVQLLGGAFAWGVFFFLRASGVSPPDDEPLWFRSKWPKPLTPRLALLQWRDANPEKSGPTRRAQTRSA